MLKGLRLPAGPFRLLGVILSLHTGGRRTGHDDVPRGAVRRVEVVGPSPVHCLEAVYEGTPG